MELKSLRLEFHMDYKIQLGLANSWKLSLSDSICYCELEFKRLEILVC